MADMGNDVWSGTPARDWLPLARDERSLHNPLNVNFIKANKGGDWSRAMCEQKRTLQARMLTKAYLFLRDYLPQGLTGPFGHIPGDDVMCQLLCHTGEQAASRQKISWDVEAAFTLLKQAKNGDGSEEAFNTKMANDTGEDSRGQGAPKGA